MAAMPTAVVNSVGRTLTRTDLKPKLLILGTGWGATSLLRSLRKPERYAITIASPRDHMLFTPLLASTATGALEHRSIIEPIRPIATSKGASFITAEAVHIEHEKNSVAFQLPDFAIPDQLVFRDAAEQTIQEIRTGSSLSTQTPNRTTASSSKPIASTRFSLNYDVLAIAVGARVNTFGVPGVDKYALFLKEATDARAVRKRIHDLFEAASLPVAVDEERRRALLTFVICGAGPTGVELAAELGDWIRDISRSRRYASLADQARIILVEASGEILSTFDKNLQSYALRALRSGRVDVRLGSKVKKVGFDSVVLETTAPSEKSGCIVENLSCGMVVWSAGVGMRDLIKRSTLPKNSTCTRLSTDGHLLCPDDNSHRSPIFAFGDCATIQGNSLVPIAQVAEQQGIYIARVLDHCEELNAQAIRKTEQPFRFFNKGMLAYVGGMRGVASVATGSKAANAPSGFAQRFLMYSGHAAWITWKLAYLSKLGSFRNKLNVPLDWIKTWLFGRDVSSF